jgi:hypothetical protein
MSNLDDLTKLPLFTFLNEGKRIEKITFTGSEELKKQIGEMATKQGKTVSDLCNEYVRAGLSSDFNKMLLIAEYKDKTLSEIMSKCK